jgi:acyl carrier protein
VVDDHPIESITSKTLTRVFTPKAAGATNLDRAVSDADIELDHFVLYSSMNGLVGGYTQVMYSAANSALQAVAWNRRRRGQHALCVDWGAMSGGGMAEASDQTIRYLKAIGARPISMDIGTEMLAECLRLDLTHVALMDVDWGEAMGVIRAISYSPRFSEQAAAARASRGGSTALRAELLALPGNQRGEVVSYLLAEQLGVVMGYAPEAIDVEVPLPDLGLDSLMAVEFGARVGNNLGIELPVMEVLGGRSLSAIGAKLAIQLEQIGEVKEA